MRVIVSGGGTGGHIYPAIAVADKVMEMDENSKVLFVGNKVGLEEELVPRTGYEFKIVKARWFDRKNPFDAIKMVIDVRKGVKQSIEIMENFKPDVVIGTGGYASVPVVMAGKKYGAKTFIQEQNSVPGMANKFLAHYAQKIFLGFEGAKPYFKNKEKQVFCGNPVRKQFFLANKEESQKKLGIKEGEFVILILGGSQGSEALNDACFDLVREVNGMNGVTVIFATGDQYFDEIMDKFKKQNVELKDNIIMRGFMDDLETYMAASDLLIERAGALSVAETCACGKAAIYVPSLNVTANHQYYNAKEVADKGGAVIINEEDLSSEIIIEEAFKIMEDEELLKNMSNISKSCSPEKATDVIYSYFTGDLD